MESTLLDPILDAEKREDLARSAEAAAAVGMLGETVSENEPCFTEKGV